MAHMHEDSETFYLDQLCLVALGGAFGGICLSLYFWQQSMLKLVLGEQFHPWVLASGILLIGITAIRAVILWTSVGPKKPQQHEHHHAEHENCGHDHEHHHHDGPCPETEHGHAHDHGHGHDAHAHDWAPWRYVVLLVPIMLFLLGLPNKGPKVVAATAHVDMTEEAIAYAGLVAEGVDPWQQLLAAAALASEANMGQVIPIEFKTLELASLTKEDRLFWKGKRVSVKGQFAPSPNSDRVFSLVRFRIRCCAADAIQLNVPMICKESVTGIKPDLWVKVTGRIDFQRRGDAYFTLLLVPNRKAIVPTEPDANPWIAN